MATAHPAVSQPYLETIMSRIVLLLIAAILWPTPTLATCQKHFVTVVWANDCAPCHAAFRFFREHGIHVEWKNSLNIGSFRNAPALGYRGTPTFNIEGNIVVGFDPTEIRRLLCIN